MSGEEETIKVVLYVVVMIIIIYIGIGFVLGFNPASWIGKLSSTTYEPGKISLTQDLEKYTFVDCTQNSYRLTLKDLKFNVKPGLSVEGNTLDFIVTLDFNNLLFVGADTTGVAKTITCKVIDGKFQCDDATINFDLSSCTGKLTGSQVFHFTTWVLKNRGVKSLKGRLGPRAIAKLHSPNVIMTWQRAIRSRPNATV